MSKHRGAVGSNLYRLRNERRLSQNSLQEKSGINTSVISRIENGKTLFPHDTTLQPLAQALGVDMAELTRGQEKDRELDGRHHPDNNFAERVKSGLILNGWRINVSRDGKDIRLTFLE